MLRSLSYVLSFIVLFQSYLAVAAPQDLERAFDEYQYALSVDWDQKDQTLFQKKTDEFFQKLDGLSLDKDAVESLAASKVTNKEALAALKLKLQMLGKNPSKQQILNVLKENSNSLYSHGASWNGDTVSTYLPIILVLAVVAYGVWFSVTHECVKWEKSNQYTCTQQSHWSCDDFGNCGTYYYPEYDCGYQDVCVEYKKK